MNLMQALKSTGASVDDQMDSRFFPWSCPKTNAISPGKYAGGKFFGCDEGVIRA